ncbi:MAG: tetratricopeptide repeat protein [Stagnimonas sp.]|nr:tetratricopeptide repeat protein [Stagnimonas sp.]
MMFLTMPVRIASLLLVSALAACAALPPQNAPGTGVVLPTVGVPDGGGVSPGGAILPGQPTGEPTPLPDTRPPLNPNLPKSIETSGAAAPVISLVKAARASLKAGRPDEAGASLERALRIEPRNAWVWQALSALHIVTQQGEQAESEAKKSISLGRRNPYLEIENWRLVSEARKLRGDKAGAEEAERKREDLQRLIAP